MADVVAFPGVHAAGQVPDGVADERFAQVLRAHLERCGWSGEAEMEVAAALLESLGQRAAGTATGRLAAQLADAIYARVTF
jgi:hypothetical protein